MVKPSHEETAKACSACGQSTWDTEQPVRKSSLVFLRTCQAFVTFLSYRCTTLGCKGLLLADGQSAGLFRQTEKVAFGLCLLYFWLGEVFGGGIPFLSIWRSTLRAYHG